MKQTHFHHEAGRQVFPNGDSNDDFRTPSELFQAFDRVWGFELDAAASKDNALCKEYFTKENDALYQTWGAKVVWCNPPYRLTSDFIHKAIHESRQGSVCWLLVPARTSTRWFLEVWNEAAEIVFVHGRLNFSGPHSIEGPKASAPFPSVLIRFGGHQPAARFGMVNRQGERLGRMVQFTLPVGLDE